MLRVYTRYLDALRELRVVIESIATHDTDLARQLRRASASVALNLAEGSGSRAGTRKQRYFTALGSARETIACLDVASALGYAVPGPHLSAELHEVAAIIGRLAN